MKILVCIKQVPQKDAPLKLNDAGTWIREDVSYEVNEPDAYALEEALRQKEKHGGVVVVMTGSLSGFVPSLAPLSIQRRRRAMVASGSGSSSRGIRFFASLLTRSCTRRLSALLPGRTTGFSPERRTAS